MQNSQTKLFNDFSIIYIISIISRYAKCIQTFCQSINSILFNLFCPAQLANRGMGDRLPAYNIGDRPPVPGGIYIESPSPHIPAFSIRINLVKLLHNLGGLRGPLANMSLGLSQEVMEQPGPTIKLLHNLMFPKISGLPVLGKNWVGVLWIFISPTRRYDKNVDAG